MDKIATRDAYGKALLELGRINKDIVVLDADTSASTRTGWFAKEFPERFFNFGIAEANMMGYAAGLSLSGKIPFVSSFAVFGALRTYEVIRTSVCWSNLNVKIVLTHAGISVGEDGPSHQSVEDIGALRVLPNMTIIVPADGIETRKAIFAAVEHKGPVYIRLGRAKFPLLTEADFKIGKARIIEDGKDVTIIACGLMVFEALKAREDLLKEGINVRVVNMPTIKPIDREMLIACAEETKGIVTAEEHSIIGGLGSAVSECLSEYKPTLIKKIGLKDTFGISGTPEELLKKFEIDSDSIKKAVYSMLNGKP
ncbi:MAG: transketolase family protein [bacterium]|nr:transketolase family protein [bacterium]